MHKGDEFPVHATAGLWTGPALPVPPTPAAIAALAEHLMPDALDLTAGHALAEFIVAAEKEKAGLVDPYVTDPDPLFKWIANDDVENGGSGGRVEQGRGQARVRRAEASTDSIAKS